MTTLRESAQQALEALELAQLNGKSGLYRNELVQVADAITSLRAALIREEEASVWLAERKDHWRKEREKAQEAKDQDPELSAALGWPGGISDPVLDRTQLLQMVAALRVAAQQALEALLNSRPLATEDDFAIKVRKHSEAITALRDALAQEQAEPETCTWYQDGDSESGLYATSCRRYFNIEDGTPEDNKMQWCCYCGKKLAQELITEDEDE